MTDIAEAGPLLVRRDWRKSALSSAAVLLVIAGWMGWRSMQGEHPPWIFPILLGAWCLISTPFVMRDRTPRIIIAGDGLSWRDARKDPLYFLPWSHILSAKFEDLGEDGRVLRLILTPPPVVEQQASGRNGPFVVDIDATSLDQSRKALRSAIHRRAPHLFADRSGKAA